MCSQQNISTFFELKQSNSDQLATLPPNSILQICIDALVGGNNCEDDIIKYILEVITAKGRLKDVGINYLQRSLVLLQDYISKKITSMETVINEDTIQTSLHSTSKLNELTLSLSNSIKEINSSVIYAVLETDLKIVELHYLFFKNRHGKNIAPVSDQLNGLLTELFANCQNLQQRVVFIIVNNVQLFMYSDMIDSNSLHKLLQGLCAVGEFVSLVSVKSTADIWKCISRISTENSTAVKSKNISVPWLQDAIAFLCEEIIQSVNIILNNIKENDFQFLTKLERILKVNSFYLKIIIKFASDFEHQHFQGCGYVVKLSVLLNSFSRDIQQSTVGQNINQYLTVGVSNLVNEIYKSANFEKELSEYEITNAQTYEAYCLLSMEIMNDIVQLNDLYVAELYFHEGGHSMLGRILQEASKFVNVFLTQNVYEKFVTTTSAAILSTIGIKHILRFFENWLLRGIFSESIICSMLCCDIMCILFRFANEDIRKHYFIFYLRIAFKTPAFSTHLNTNFAFFLLKSFLEIMSKDQWKRIVGEYKNKNAFNLARLTLNTNRNINEITTHETNGQLLNFEQNLSKQLYYDFAKDILLSQKVNKDNVINLWTQSIRFREVSGNQVLVKSILMFLTNNLNSTSLVNTFFSSLDYNSISKMDRLFVLKLLVALNDNSRIVISEDVKLDLYILLFVSDEKFSADIGGNLQNIISKYSTPAVNSTAQNTYFSKLAAYNFKHSCKIKHKLDILTDNFEMFNPTKRLRSSEDGVCCPLLAKAKNLANEIREYFCRNDCSKEDLTQLRNIIDIFIYITKQANK